MNIGDGAFMDCSNLDSIAFSDDITNIGLQAFGYCASLTNISIPRSVAHIDSWAFIACTALDEIFFMGNAPSLGYAVFDNDNTTVYYLPGTTGWGDFSTNSGLTTVLWNPLIQTGDGYFGVRGNQFGFDITGTAGIPVVVEACTNLANSNWVPVQSLVLTNGLSYFSDPQWRTYPVRYYRISPPF